MVQSAYTKPKERIIKYVRKDSDNEKRLSDKKHRSKIKGGKYNKNGWSDW